MIRPLNELFALRADYYEYNLVTKKGSYRDLSKYVLRSRKIIGVQMRPHVFSGSDANAVMSFLAKFKVALNLNRVLESTAG